jgi:Phosphodiester glycosidase
MNWVTWVITSLALVVSVSNTSAEIIILDNDDGAPGYTETGSWIQSTSTGYNGGIYRYCYVASGLTATWTANLPAADQYEVVVWYRDGTNRSTGVQYDIQTATGTESVTIDQRGNGLAWTSLGTFDFNAGSTTVVLNAAASASDGVCISDAVGFYQGGAPPPPPPTVVTTEVIEPGIVYTQYHTTDPVVIHVLEFDLADPELTIDMGFALGRRNYGSSRERTSAIATRYDQPGNEVIAAINAAFYGTLLEVRGGTWAAGGNLVTLPDYTSAHDVWALQDNDVTWVARRPFYPATTDARVRFENATELVIDNLNCTITAGQYAIYTPDWGSSTSITTQGVEVMVEDVNFPLRPEKRMVGRIAAIRTGSQTVNTSIPAGGFILRAASASDTVLLNNAVVGESLELEIDLGHEILNNVGVLQHARGILVDDGVASPESWIYSDSYARHPRTVIASQGSTHFFVVFDGRSTESIGVNVEHMADFLVNTLHVDMAANVDGGGSSTLWINGTIYNVPSDGTERSVVNALLLTRRDQPSALPMADSFPAEGRELEWEDKLWHNPVVSFSPDAPDGDGYVLEILNTDEGFETAAVGVAIDHDLIVEADVYCDHRPEVASDGFERLGLFVRDDGNGNFESPALGGGNCYALVFETDSGEVLALSLSDGVETDLTEAMVALTEDGWRHFRIRCEGDRLLFTVDGEIIANVIDATHTHGQVGIGHRSHFTTPSNALGAHVDNFAVTPVPDESAVVAHTLYR